MEALETAETAKKLRDKARALSALLPGAHRTIAEIETSGDRKLVVSWFRPPGGSAPEFSLRIHMWRTSNSAWEPMSRFGLNVRIENLPRLASAFAAALDCIEVSKGWVTLNLPAVDADADSLSGPANPPVTP